MIGIASVIGFYLSPILSIVFCANLVSILKKIKNNEDTYKNTFWLTLSFTIIVWNFSMLLLI